MTLGKSINSDTHMKIAGAQGRMTTMRDHQRMSRVNQPSPCGCRLSSLRLHAAVTYIAKHSSANGKNSKYPGIGISKIFHCWNMGKM